MGFSTMSQTYILIDFENVQPIAEDLNLIRGGITRFESFTAPISPGLTRTW